MKIIIIALLVTFTPLLNAEMVVVANLNNTVNSLTKKQIQAIFMGRARSFSNGVRAMPLDASDLRDEFYEKLTHRSIQQIDAYWARLVFSGQSTAPKLKEDQQAVLNAVKSNKGAIAYIDSKQSDITQVKRLFIFE